MRTVIGIASIVILLAFTVLMPPSAFFDPQVTPDEVQLPDERPCEDHSCKDTKAFLQGHHHFKEIVEPATERRNVWPPRPLLKSQFDPEDYLKPPSRRS